MSKLSKKTAVRILLQKGRTTTELTYVNLNTGCKHYHQSKGGLLHSVMLTPEEAPEWLLELSNNYENFFSYIEGGETRKDAQYMREVTIGLPHELSGRQNIELATAFVQTAFVDQGMVANLVIHKPTDKGDQRNIHAHILLTMREIQPDGFGKKVRAWNRLVPQWRENWEAVANGYLVEKGFEARVKMKSYKKRGIDKEASKYIGPQYTPKKTKERHLGAIDIASTLEKALARTTVNAGGRAFSERSR